MARRRSHRFVAARNPATFHGYTVQPIEDRTGPERDAYVLVGIGPAGQYPAVFLQLCPCDGVDGLIADLQLAAAAARPWHRSHAA
jgi:hypothetical protein